MRVIVIGIVGAVLFFAIQLVLCFKAKRTGVKLIPAYIILACVLFMVADFAGALEYSGFISGQGILAMMLAVVVGIALVGEVAAWTIYLTLKRNTRWSK